MIDCFKKYYRDFVVKTKATMHIGRKPGETMEVDWAGQTARIVDTDTGADIEAYVFVAALPYSGYAYAEAFPSQNQEAWISAEYVAGVEHPEPGRLNSRGGKIGQSRR